jgi:hypothetical protein
MSDPLLLIKQIKEKIREMDNDISSLLKNKKENIGKGNQNGKRRSQI